VKDQPADEPRFGYLRSRLRHALVEPRWWLTALLLLLVLGGLFARDMLGPAADAPRFDGFRTAFSPGEAGWAEFRGLADAAATDIGPALSVLVLITGAHGASPKVYFIPSASQPLHWEFAHAKLRLEATAFTRETFDWVTYEKPDRDQLAATLVWYPERTVHPDDARPENLRPDSPAVPAAAPMTLRFAAGDSPTAEEIRLAHALIAARMPMLGDAPLFYAPSTVFHERRLADQAGTLEAAGIQWLLERDLYAGVTFQALNPGVAYGMLRAVDGDALTDGSLSNRDIIVLDRLPLDLPLVGGTLSAELQTPLAHVNVLAKARQTPNMALLDARSDPRIAPFLDQLVRFEVFPGGFRIEPAEASEVDRFWSERLAGRSFVPEADLTIAEIKDLDAIGFRDFTAFGAKAANLAELHRLLPEIAPGGLAVPFAAYESHLLRATVRPADCARFAAACREDLGGDFGSACARAETVCTAAIRSAGPANLREFIEAILARPDFRTDSKLRAALLHGFRTAIETQPLDPAFAAALREATAAKFGGEGFRLRSSTNAEDLEGFSGAGLYDSMTAYASGDKKPVADQIRRVWSSAWDWKAFEERAWWGVSHLDVRMGVLVNRAFPDEQCNGVLITRDVSRNSAEGASEEAADDAGMYVNIQKGETSVTNPEGGVTPEIVSLDESALGWHATVRQFSSLSPDGALMTPAEVNRLADVAYEAHAHFSDLYGKRAEDIAFELEFKVHGPERELIVKQIRPY
jgi:pyruvate,water dikinase